MIKSRSSHVRMKIVALLASMAALWGFAAYVTVRDGLNVLFVNTLTTHVGHPTESLVDALQQERRVSVVALSDHRLRDELAISRERTDQAVEAWRSGVESSSLRFAASDQLLERIDWTTAELDQLDELRAGIDDGEIDRATTNAAYTAMIDANFGVYGSLSSLDDQEIARQSRALIELTRSRELMSQQDALLAGALAAGELTAQEVADFTKLVGTQRFLYRSTSIELVAEDYQLYEQAVASPAVTQLRELEDRFIERARPGGNPPFTARVWNDTMTAAITEMRELELAAADQTLERAAPAVLGVVVRLLLAGGLGLIAVIAATVISVTTARSLVRQLERLRDAARELATDRLPRVVERLSKGEQVNVATEAPPLEFGNDEIGQVGHAFNAVQETAVRAAVQQAELRHGVRDVFLSLARRTQNLVHKQLGVVDAMERRETDADEMEDLYRIDHLATRMRRNAENLIVLSGATPGRTWRRPVPMIDVIRGAVAEVEDYRRVNLMPVQAGALEGRVVGDVIHLLAELIENAASFSPPYAMVGVGGQRVAHGFVVEVEDRGLGMSEADLNQANRHLAEPPDFNLADASRLGHYVVSKLAQRHGVRVHLRTSPYGGITAIVLIPQEIMSEVDDDDNEPSALPGPAGGGGPGPMVESVPRPATVPLPPGVINGHPGESNGNPLAPPHSDTVALPELSPPRAPVVPANPASSPPNPVSPPPELPSRNGAARRGATTGPDAIDPGATLGGPATTPETDSGTDDAPAADQRTPAGLPWRVKQASLPKQLWDDEDADDELSTRDPEQVRRAMSSYQIGTQRGRSDAASGESSPTQEKSGEQPDDRKEG